MQTSKVFAALAALAGAFLATAPQARAGLLPVSQASAPEAGGWRYSYGIVLTTDAHLNAGDSFTVYDFAGLVPGSNLQPPGWSLSVADTSSSGGKTVPTDDPNLPNLTWTYNGPQVNGQKGLGSFSVLSSVGQTQTESFIARTHRNLDGHADDNITDVTVPLEPPEPQAPPPSSNSPEPATLALLAIGLPLAGAARLARRRARSS
jgi:hypothetical protein